MADLAGTQEYQQEQQQQQDTEVAATEMGPGGVPKGKCYLPGNPVFSNQIDVPARTEYAQSEQDWFQGYNIKPVHPVYRTSNSDYGARPPSVHTMPTKFCAKTQKFSENLGKCGMPRNHSLNCGMDKSVVPDH